MSLIGNGEYKSLNHGGRILAVFFGPWGAPLLIAIGWLPMVVVQVMSDVFGDPHYSWPGFAMAYFFFITLPASLCAVLVLLGQCAYLLLRLRRHAVARLRDHGQSK